MSYRISSRFVAWNIGLLLSAAIALAVQAGEPWVAQSDNDDDDDTEQRIQEAVEEAQDTWEEVEDDLDGQEPFQEGEDGEFQLGCDLQDGEDCDTVEDAEMFGVDEVDDSGRDAYESDATLTSFGSEQRGKLGDDDGVPGETYEILQQEFGRSAVDMSNDPMWDLSREVFDQATAGDFGDCEVTWVREEDDEEGHLPDERRCYVENDPPNCTRERVADIQRTVDSSVTVMEYDGCMSYKWGTDQLFWYEDFGSPVGKQQWTSSLHRDRHGPLVQMVTSDLTGGEIYNEELEFNQDEGDGFTSPAGPNWDQSEIWYLRKDEIFNTQDDGVYVDKDVYYPWRTHHRALTHWLDHPSFRNDLSDFAHEFHFGPATPLVTPPVYTTWEMGVEEIPPWSWGGEWWEDWPEYEQEWRYSPVEESWIDEALDAGHRIELVATTNEPELLEVQAWNREDVSQGEWVDYLWRGDDQLCDPNEDDDCVCEPGDPTCDPDADAAATGAAPMSAEASTAETTDAGTQDDEGEWPPDPMDVLEPGATDTAAEPPGREPENTDSGIPGMYVTEFDPNKPAVSFSAAWAWDEGDPDTYDHLQQLNECEHEWPDPEEVWSVYSDSDRFSHPGEEPEAERRHLQEEIYYTEKHLPRHIEVRVGLRHAEYELTNHAKSDYPGPCDGYEEDGLCETQWVCTDRQTRYVDEMETIPIEGHYFANLLPELYPGDDQHEQAPCWEAELVIDCPTGSGVDVNCEQYEEDPECAWLGRECMNEKEGEESGHCYVERHEYDCGYSVDRPGWDVEREEDCDGEFRCVGEKCVDPNHTPSDDFEKAASMLQVAEHMLTDLECEEDADSAEDCKVFSGEAGACRVSTGSAIGFDIDCCAETAEEVDYGDYLRFVFKSNKMMRQTAGVDVIDAGLGWIPGMGRIQSVMELSESQAVSAADALLAWSEAAAEDAVDGMVQEWFQNMMQDFADWLAERFSEEVRDAVFDTAASGAVEGLASNVASSISMVSTAYTIYSTAELANELINQCEEEDLEIGTGIGRRTASFQGEYCDRRTTTVGWGNTCTRYGKAHCNFDSPLARILQEQIRKQIDKPWGDVNSDDGTSNLDCSGIPVSKLDEVDWDQVDLDEYINMLYDQGLMPEIEDMTLEEMTGDGSYLLGDGDDELRDERPDLSEGDEYCANPEDTLDEGEGICYREENEDDEQVTGHYCPQWNGDREYHRSGDTCYRKAFYTGELFYEGGPSMDPIKKCEIRSDDETPVEQCESERQTAKDLCSSEHGLGYGVEWEYEMSIGDLNPWLHFYCRTSSLDVENDCDLDSSEFLWPEENPISDIFAGCRKDASTVTEEVGTCPSGYDHDTEEGICTTQSLEYREPDSRDNTLERNVRRLEGKDMTGTRNELRDGARDEDPEEWPPDPDEDD